MTATAAMAVAVGIGLYSTVLKPQASIFEAEIKKDTTIVVWVENKDQKKQIDELVKNGFKKGTTSYPDENIQKMQSEDEKVQVQIEVKKDMEQALQKADELPNMFLTDHVTDLSNYKLVSLKENVYDSMDKNAYLFLPENEEMFGEMKEIPTGLDTLLLYSCSFEYNKDNTLTDSCFMDRTDNTIKLSELIAEDSKKATENQEDSSMLNNQYAAVLDDDSLSNVLLLNNEISWKKVASKKALPDDTMIRNLSSLQTLRVTAQNGTEKDSDKYQINKGKKKQKVYGSNILAGVAYRKIMNNARDNKGEGANTLKDYKTYVVTDEEGKMLVEFSERYAITQASSTDQQTACMRLLWVMLSEAGQTQKNQQEQTTYPIMRSVFEKFQTYNAGYEGFSELEQARTQCITTGPNNRELLRFVSGIGKKQKVEGIKKYTDSYAEN